MPKPGGSASTVTPGPLKSGPMRAATASIDLAALRHNLAVARAKAGHAEVAAVVKADAYGHGAARVLPALAKADKLAVACIEEALALRDAGAVRPILLLEGVFEPDELPLCAAHGLEIVVHEPGQIRMLETTRLERPVPVWLKIDTGMHRLGVQPHEVEALAARLEGCANVARLGLMTHLAEADTAGSDATTRQIERFATATAGLDGPRSIANSAGLLAWHAARADLARPGIMLWGCSPLAGSTGPAVGLLPVMTLKTKLIAVQPVAAGEAVGYGGTWRASRATRIGIAAIGYGDGYPRHAPAGTPVLVAGRRHALVGRVSMDMLAVDLGLESIAGVGAAVTLWGEGLPVETVAAAAGTIGYELLCGVTSRVHVRLVGA